MEVFTDNHSGYKFVMASGNDCANHIKKHGIFEWPLIKWCEQFCSPDKLFLDIGAHMGTYSMHLSKFSDQVYAFEAQASTFKNLTRGIELNGRVNIKANNFGLSDYNGDSALFKVSADGGGSTLDQDVADHIGDKFGKELVHVRTLDSFALDNVGFLKLDVEGSELNVLKGGLETLERSGWPKFIFEAWPDAWYAKQRQELITFVKSLGYTVTPIRGYNNMYLAHH